MKNKPKVSEIEKSIYRLWNDLRDGVITRQQIETELEAIANLLNQLSDE